MSSKHVLLLALAVGLVGFGLHGAFFWGPLRLTCDSDLCVSSDGRQWPRKSCVNARVELSLARGRGIRTVQMSRIVFSDSSSPVCDWQQKMFEQHDRVVKLLQQEGRSVDAYLEGKTWIFVKAVLFVVSGVVVGTITYLLRLSELKTKRA